MMARSVVAYAPRSAALWGHQPVSVTASRYYVPPTRPPHATLAMASRSRARLGISECTPSPGSTGAVTHTRPFDTSHLVRRLAWPSALPHASGLTTFAVTYYDVLGPADISHPSKRSPSNAHDKTPTTTDRTPLPRSFGR